jgi:hypothetical protein
MEHKLLTKHQSGNRKLHSTETLDIAITDILLEAIDKNQLSIIIFLDLSKAFDSVKLEIWSKNNGLRSNNRNPQQVQKLFVR